MRRVLFFAAGCALLVALVWFAGATAIAATLSALGIDGLLLACALHLPVVILMALALWYAAGKAGSQTDYIAARVIRDAAADILPFSQLGGFAAGLRVLQIRGQQIQNGALAIFLDLLMEFVAKLPHTSAGLVLLIWLAPNSHLVLPLILLLLVVGLAAGAAYVFRGRLQALCEAAARRAVVRWTTAGGHPRSLQRASRRRVCYPALLCMCCAGS